MNDRCSACGSPAYVRDTFTDCPNPKCENYVEEIRIDQDLPFAVLLEVMEPRIPVKPVDNGEPESLAITIRLDINETLRAISEAEEHWHRFFNSKEFIAAQKLEAERHKLAAAILRDPHGAEEKLRDLEGVKREKTTYISTRSSPPADSKGHGSQVPEQLLAPLASACPTAGGVFKTTNGEPVYATIAEWKAAESLSCD